MRSSLVGWLFGNNLSINDLAISIIEPLLSNNWPNFHNFTYWWLTDKNFEELESVIVSSVEDAREQLWGRWDSEYSQDDYLNDIYKSIEKFFW